MFHVLPSSLSPMHPLPSTASQHPPHPHPPTLISPHRLSHFSHALTSLPHYPMQHHLSSALSHVPLSLPTLISHTASLSIHRSCSLLVNLSLIFLFCASVLLSVTFAFSYVYFFVLGFTTSLNYVSFFIVILFLYMILCFFFCHLFWFAAFHSVLPSFYLSFLSYATM